MTYVSQFGLWGAPGNHVAALPPSPGDLFVLTTVQGKRVFLDPITEYEAAVRRAHALGDRLVHSERVVIKVLCVTHLEACAVLQIKPADLFANETPEQEAAMRQVVVTACHDALRNSQDANVRSDALKLLNDMKDH